MVFTFGSGTAKLLIGLNCTNLSIPLSTVGFFADGSGSKAAAYDAIIMCVRDVRESCEAFRHLIV